MNRNTALMSLSQSVDSGLLDLDRTRNLYSGGGPGNARNGADSSYRLTVEVLDDAGQDLTPRDDAELKREKVRSNLLAAEAAQVRQIRSSEQSFRTYQFTSEQTRVAKRDDTFVPAPNVKISDVTRERSRLDGLEESARQLAHRYQQEAESRREFVQQDVAASKVQALFRGAIGRQKYQLVKRLKDLDESGTDWIEVRDRQSGDAWFYNKKTGVSQWNRPDEMDGQVSSSGSVKRLPFSSPSSSTRRAGSSEGRGGSAARTGSSGGTGVVGGGESMGMDRIRTAPINASRTFTAATTLPSLDSLHRAKTAATATADRSTLHRKVSFNMSMEATSASEAVRLMDTVGGGGGEKGVGGEKGDGGEGGEGGAMIHRVQTPAKSDRDRDRSSISPFRSASPFGATPLGSRGESRGVPGTTSLRNIGSPFGHTADSDATTVLDWDQESARERERERDAQKHVEKALGLDKIMPHSNLLDPRGSFKPHLRTTVHDALISTRFDAVTNVMSNADWTDAHASPFTSLRTPGGLSRTASPTTVECSPFSPLKLNKIDQSRRPMVAVFNLSKKKPLALQGARINIDHGADRGVPSEGSTPSRRRARTPMQEAAKLAIREVDHREANVEVFPSQPGTAEGNRMATAMSAMGVDDEMCFGCWSAGGQRKCHLHEVPYSTRKASESMVLCSNWELAVMRRRYRAEDIQEIFEKKKSSLRFISKAKKFMTVVEQRHQIYRQVQYAIDQFNFRFVTFLKAKNWMHSFADALRMGRVRPRATIAIAKKIRDRRTRKSHTAVANYHKTIHQLLPMAPITGFSWPERTGAEQYLFKHFDEVCQVEVEVIYAEPVPVPMYLYQPRKYVLPLPICIPMPRPDYGGYTETGE